MIANVVQQQLADYVRCTSTRTLRKSMGRKQVSRSHNMAFSLLTTTRPTLHLDNTDTVYINNTRIISQLHFRRKSYSRSVEREMSSC